MCWHRKGYAVADGDRCVSCVFCVRRNSRRLESHLTIGEYGGAILKPDAQDVFIRVRVSRQQFNRGREKATMGLSVALAYQIFDFAFWR